MCMIWRGFVDATNALRYGDVTSVYDDVTYVYDDVTHVSCCLLLCVSLCFNARRTSVPFFFSASRIAFLLLKCFMHDIRTPVWPAHAQGVLLQ